MRARLGALVLCALLARQGAAEALDPGFVETRWGFTETLLDGMAWAPDGSHRLFTIHKSGAVRVTRLEADGSATVLPTPFAELSPIFLGSECGLIGMAFDPDFASTGYVYFFVTVSATEQQIIRYTAVGDVGRERTVLVPMLPTTGRNHDGGALAIGPDGKLYWAIGDEGMAIGVNADTTWMACKIGRINRDGSVPDDNPFADGPGPNDERIWARGFRNPFTMTFEPARGRLWLNVVGTNYEQIFVVGRGDHGGWMLHENDQAAGYLRPVISYRTRGPEQFTLATVGEGAVRSGGIASFRTTAPHGLRKGEKVTISGVSDASFDGSFFVASASDDPQAVFFTVRQPGPDASAGNGSVATMAQGSVVTGGTFYDATAFSPAFRGNFFYTDFGSGRIMRVTLADDGSVATVDQWATAPTSIDAAVGPDGALYVGSFNGSVYRYAPRAPTQQAIVVSRQLVDFGEGMDAVFDVSLAVAPVDDVVVMVDHSAGSPGVSVSAGQILRFSPANARTPQPVRLHAVADADERSEQALFTLALGGTLVRETVTARVLDAAGPSFGDGGLLEDDGGAGDAGIAGDAELADPGAGAGCGCHSGSSGPPTGLALLLVLLGGCWLTRRSRR